RSPSFALSLRSRLACSTPFPYTTLFRSWTHMLGYRGHFLTKSRRYSVTFGQLRATRTDYRRTQHHPDGEKDPWGRDHDDTTVLVDRKSTRLNSSHQIISYAVFCLKKKNR